MVEGLCRLLCGERVPSQWRGLQAADLRVSWWICRAGKVKVTTGMRAKPLVFLKAMCDNTWLAGVFSMCEHMRYVHHWIHRWINSEQESEGNQRKGDRQCNCGGRYFEVLKNLVFKKYFNNHNTYYPVIIPNPSPCTSMCGSTISLALCPARRSCREVFPSTWPSSVLGPLVEAHPVPSGGTCGHVQMVILGKATLTTWFFITFDTAAFDIEPLHIGHRCQFPCRHPKWRFWSEDYSQWKSPRKHRCNKNGFSILFLQLTTTPASASVLRK